MTRVRPLPRPLPRPSLPPFLAVSLALALVWVWAATPGPLAAQDGDRWAVVIGISEYADASVPDLAFASADARAFYDFLRSPAAGADGLPASNVRLLLDGDATARNVRGALTTFLRQAGPDDVVLLFLAGHGVADPYRPEDHYLLTHDTRSADMAGTGIPLAEVRDALTGAGADHSLLFADLSHAGPVAELSADARGFVTLLSAQPGQLSQEGERWGGGHGVFAHFLVEGLTGPADRDRDGVVRLGEALEYTRDRVRRATGNGQIPVIAGAAYDRSLPLATVEGGPAPTPAPLQRQRWAVVIGVGEHARPDLGATPHADDDARAFHDFLRSPAAGMGGFDDDHIRLLTNGDATARDVRSALSRFLRPATPDDMVLVFLAGPVLADPYNPEDRYLAVYDTDPSDLPATAVPLDWIVEALSDAYAHQKVVFAEPGLPGPLRGTGIVLNASEEGRPGRAGAEWAGGVYTHFLLRGLRGDADADRDRVVTVVEAVEYTRDQVRRVTSNDQIPGVLAGDYDRYWPLAAVLDPGG